MSKSLLKLVQPMYSYLLLCIGTDHISPHVFHAHVLARVRVSNKISLLFLALLCRMFVVYFCQSIFLQLLYLHPILNSMRSTKRILQSMHVTSRTKQVNYNINSKLRAVFKWKDLLDEVGFLYRKQAMVGIYFYQQQFEFSTIFLRNFVDPLHLAQHKWEVNCL